MIRPGDDLQRPTAGYNLRRNTQEDAAEFVHHAVVRAYVRHITVIVHENRRPSITHTSERNGRVHGVVARARNDWTGRGSAIAAGGANRQYVENRRIGAGHPRHFGSIEGQHRRSVDRATGVVRPLDRRPGSGTETGA